MVLIGLAVALGLAVGRTLPTPPRHAVPFDFRAWPALAVGVGALLLSTQLDSGGALVVHVGALAVLAAVVAANLHLTGMGVVGVGLLCNLGVIVLNGGMPVRPGALVEAGVADVDELPSLELRGGRHLERDDDILTFLGDAAVFPVGHSVVSIGDLIVAVGLADVVANLTRGRRRPQDHEADAPGNEHSGADTVPVADDVIDLRSYVPGEEALAQALAARSTQPAADTRRSL